MASHAAEQPTRSDTRPVPQPQRSTIQANTVGVAALIAVALPAGQHERDRAADDGDDPCDAPMTSVNATISGRLPVPATSRSSERRQDADPTVIARRLRAKTISTTRLPNWATPFIEATQTAAAVASPAASSSGSSCADDAEDEPVERHDESEECDGDRARAAFEGRRGTTRLGSVPGFDVRAEDKYETNQMLIVTVPGSAYE